MRLALAAFAPPTDERLRFIAQLGVRDIVVWGTTFRGPREGRAVSFKELLTLRTQTESHGLRITAVETLPIQSYDKLIFGEDGREEQLERAIEMVRNLGRAGIPTLGYNWMPQGVWRTHLRVPLRAGASGTGFDLRDAMAAPPIRGREFGEDEFWDHYAWFLERILPVCEEEDVVLAAHPNDPPVERLGGAPCLLRSRAAFERAFDLVPSAHHRLCFCLGNWTEMGEDVFDAIRHFGPLGKIDYVHFQAVRGTVPAFHETFVDEGDLDAWKVIRALDESGFRGVMIPGHTPEMEGDAPWRTEESQRHTPYYHPMGGYRSRAYAAGYLQGLLHALRGRPETHAGEDA